MSDQMTEQTVEIIFKIDNIPKKEFYKILPKDYSKKEIELAGDLLERMLQWNPNERVSCEEALKHEFFKRGFWIELVNILNWLDYITH